MILVLASAVALSAADPQPMNVSRKLDLIESGKAKPGATFHFTPAELNAWVRVKAPGIIHDGFREPRLELGNGTASASVRHSEGIETNWLIAKLIQGEKLVTAKARIQSANGRATVHVLRVEIGGLAVTGAPLDFLIQNFLLPFYPDAKIDEPFALAGNVDRIVITLVEARVYIRPAHVRPVQIPCERNPESRFRDTRCRPNRDPGSHARFLRFARRAAHAQPCIAPLNRASGRCCETQARLRDP